MLTKVILEGPMGKEFGREWELSVSSPKDALRLIDANKKGVFVWIRQNLEKYATYQVICEYEDGRTEELDKDTYVLQRQVKTIRFVPVVTGASGALKVIVGIVLLVISYFVPFLSPYLAPMGMSLIVGGIVEMLSPRAKKTGNDEKENKDHSSYLFDGPSNTTSQGVPVQLIYGRCLVGSQAISAALTVDQLL